MFNFVSFIDSGELVGSAGGQIRLYFSSICLVKIVFTARHTAPRY